ncbi:BC85_0335 family putative methyltransferase [Mycoplasmopsis fermentans]|uniref:Methyltransferase n=1 Tax=Mycoplasmopsis fermentans (strain M64) TaxID=943945 RepID=A0AB32XBV3_MYCFM|nr:hypothetical protein [Mycoplasmopsis fermentans]ADV34512.1 Conserved Hypothetical Protein [Mycoplasmopsis fermentans M64]
MISAVINLSKGAKIGLIVSAIVFVIIAFITYIILLVKTRKIRNEINTKEAQKAHEAILKIRGEELGEFPKELKEFFKSNLDDYDLENFINTIYLNDVQEILLVGSKLEYPTALFKNKSQAQICLEKQKMNVSLWNKAVLELPKYFKDQPSFINVNELKTQDKKFKLIFSINSTETNQELFDKYYPMLSEKGMLVVLQNSNTKSGYRVLTKHLKLNKIVYELSYVKSGFLYIVKSKTEIKNEN